MDIVLASASPRRKELLALLTKNFRVAVSDVDESGLTAAAPAQLAQVLAQAKCAAVAQQHPDSVVIGCDTVVDVDGQVLGKPKNRADAQRMLTLLSGRSHLVHTGVSVQSPHGERTFAVTSTVHFSAIDPQELEAYLNTDEPYDKAGAYGIQGYAARFVTGIEGCYFNIVGLPVSALYQVLREQGVL
jgi:septum formation protein